MDCSPWLGNTAYWVEDYRRGLFYYVSDNGEPADTFLSISGASPLPDGAKATTEELQKRYSIPVVTAAFDYGHFLVNGQVDWAALAAFNRTADKLMPITDSYVVYSREGLEGGLETMMYGRESAQDKQELREFLDFVNTLTFHYTDDYWEYQDGYEAIVRLYCSAYEVKEFRIGRYAGKPVIVDGTVYANCSEEAYARWRDWALEKAQACHLPPEEEMEEETAATTPSSKTMAT